MKRRNVQNQHTTDCKVACSGVIFVYFEHAGVSHPVQNQAVETCAIM